MIVFLVPGLGTAPAGPSWPWGAYHGRLLLIERVPRRRARGADRPVRLAHLRDGHPGRPRLVSSVPLADPRSAAGYTRPSAGRLGPAARPSPAALDPLRTIGLVFAARASLLPRTWVTGLRIENPLARSHRVLRLVVVGLVLPAALVFVISGTFSPFLYFQF